MAIYARMIYIIHASIYDTEFNPIALTSICVNVQITYPTSQLVEIVH